MKRQRNILIIIIILLGFLSFVLIDRSMSLGNELVVSQQNNKALADTVRISKNKLGVIVASKNILVTDKKDLSGLNSDLSNELKKGVGKIRELNILVARLKTPIHDTIIIKNTVIANGDGVYGLKWAYDTLYVDSNSRLISGISEFRLDEALNVIPLNTKIIKDEMTIKIVSGLREKDGNVEIFATSTYPGFETIKLDGAIIDPSEHPVLKKFTKTKKWGVGPYVGIGLDGNLNSSIQFGIGINYSLYKF